MQPETSKAMNRHREGVDDVARGVRRLTGLSARTLPFQPELPGALGDGVTLQEAAGLRVECAPQIDETRARVALLPGEANGWLEPAHGRLGDAVASP